MAILFNTSYYATGGFVNTTVQSKKIDFTLQRADTKMYDAVIHRLYVSIEGEDSFCVQSTFSQFMIKDGNVLSIFSEMCRGEMQVRGVPDEAIKYMETFLGGDNPTHGLYQFVHFTSPPGIASLHHQSASYRQPEIDRLPGLKEIVKHPANPDYESAGLDQGYGTLEYVIISLNDKHNWTRDQIADWLETLDIDLTFKEDIAPPVDQGPSGEKGPEGEKGPNAKPMISYHEFKELYLNNQLTVGEFKKLFETKNHQISLYDYQQTLQEEQ